ncbi:hypothetical protein [Saccharolobus islandicus]|uniref:hypothetical protein n=1 Tax=Saccharolobus islandicus TaxID=43080 RepID=UPI00036E672A|nr:hypothetical protein [Sulfolobus islandicus]
MTIILSDNDKKILERMHNRIDYIFKTYKEYFDALAEFDKTGVLKVHGKILYVRKYENKQDENRYNLSVETGKRSIILTILELAREKQIVLSKTKIQKLVFLVQKELGKEYFKFVPYKYGPWSSELAEELDKLANEGIVKKYEKDSSNFYELQTQAEKDKEVERKANKYISMPLEYLLALIYARYPEMTELSEIKEKVKEFQKRFNIL